MKADVNVIDFDNAQVPMRLRWSSICPPSGRRLIQKADGYKHTIVSGEVIPRRRPAHRCDARQDIRGGQLRI